MTLAKELFRSGLGLVILAFLSGCVGMAVSRDVGNSEGIGADSSSIPFGTVDLLPVSALREDVLLRQRVTISWRDREENLEAVMQKRGAELLVVGLGPMNAVGFTIKLDDHGVSFENRVGRELPFEAERILADIQRVFYPWIASDTECRDCVRQGRRGRITITERVGSEFLEERLFEFDEGIDQSDGPGRSTRGVVSISYQDWIGGTSIPGRAILQNEALGYRLTIETTSVENIGASRDEPEYAR